MLDENIIHKYDSLESLSHNLRSIDQRSTGPLIEPAIFILHFCHQMKFVLFTTVTYSLLSIKYIEYSVIRHYQFDCTDTVNENNLKLLSAELLYSSF